MDRPKITDTEFQVVQAPPGMTWRQYDRLLRRERRMQRRAEREALKRLHAWTPAQHLQYVAYMGVVQVVGLVVLKLGAIIWSALQPPAPSTAPAATLELHSPSERH